MRRIRPVRPHADRRGLLPNVLSDGVLGKDLPTPTIGLSLPDITSLIPLPGLSNSASGSLSDPPSSSFTLVSSTSTSSSLSSSSVRSTSNTPSPTPTSPPASSVYETTSGGKVHTLTTFLDAAPTSTHSAVPAPKSFLQNKVLSGVVFALVGLIGLVVILAIATFALRRKRNNRLLKEAISFDPSSTTDSTHHYGDEKDRMSMGFGSPRASDDHSSQGHTGYNAFGANYAQGRIEHNITFPQPPARALSPHPEGYARGAGEKMPAPAQLEGISWGRSLTPVPAPLLPTFGSSNQTENTADQHAQSQNRILKVANE